MLFSVLWHAHVLKIRGVWLCRDPDDTPPMAEEEQGGDVEAARAEEEESAAEPDPSPRKRKKGAGEEEEGMGVAAAAAGGEELATPSSAAGRRAGKGGSAVVVLKKQMTLEEKVGAVKSLARRGFKDYCQVSESQPIVSGSRIDCRVKGLLNGRKRGEKPVGRRSCLSCVCGGV